jgi:general secretion pathway protein G
MSAAEKDHLAVCREKSSGFTLIELIIATAILVTLTGMAVPLARVGIKREKERQLRYSLSEMRDAIDRYKDIADRGAFQIKVGSQGYPPDLETLVKGVDIQGKKLRFLRQIPLDPTTGQPEWGLRSMQDDPDSDSWDGQSIYNVYSKSQDTALDGTRYKDW